MSENDNHNNDQSEEFIRKEIMGRLTERVEASKLRSFGIYECIEFIAGELAALHTRINEIEGLSHALSEQVEELLEE